MTSFRRSVPRAARSPDVRLPREAKEKVLECAPRWSEEQAERALRAAEGDEFVDAWGDLSTLHEVSAGETMRRVAEEERASGNEPW